MEAYTKPKTGTSEFCLHDIAGHFIYFCDGYGNETKSIEGAEVAFKHDSSIPFRVLNLHNKNHKFHIYEQEHLIVILQEEA